MVLKPMADLQFERAAHRLAKPETSNLQRSVIRSKYQPIRRPGQPFSVSGRDRVKISQCSNLLAIARVKDRQGRTAPLDSELFRFIPRTYLFV
jgi:hypothetical protein